ncbi:MAG: KH domain-containing protein [Candidatus Odinarchaeum yellowstonii]|uniref:KH domain-containing protein n=1 Tax=Odinarchaeota yellowstonii (strain LCB_4) TaxID=1841599 RepID=A0AAF0D355_ODILC|nr:MAG: KH domain-containing protein [Candidatus Odinarchaeum yellowstonii]
MKNIIEAIRIPKERVGVVIGKGGETKAIIEQATHTKLTVDSENNTVMIEASEDADPLSVWKAKQILTAIARGFSPKNALKLVDDDVFLDVIDLKSIFPSEKSQIRIKGRIIGEKGKTRKIIEELSETKISVYGDTVAIIGEEEEVKIAKKAVEMFIKGLSHATVYKYLSKMKQELKQKKYDLWERTPELKEENKER